LKVAQLGVGMKGSSIYRGAEQRLQSRPGVTVTRLMRRPLAKPPRQKLKQPLGGMICRPAVEPS